MRLTSSCKPVYILLLVFNFLINYQASAQSCPEDAIIYSTDSYTDIYVNEDSTVCISVEATMYGNIYMNGGTLKNNGTIKALILNNGYGVIENYGKISDTETSVSIVKDLTINSYPEAYMEFTENVDFYGSYIHTFRQYNGATVSFAQELNFIKGDFVIINGATITVDSSPVLKTAYFNAADASFDNANLSVSNSATGELNFAGSLNLNNSGTKTIINEGFINIYNSFNIGGDAEWGTTTVQNKNRFFINVNLSSNLFNGSFRFTNEAPADANEGTVALYGSLNLYSDSSTFINKGYLNTIVVSIGDGTLLNNGTLSADYNFSNNNGLFVNNGRTEVTNLFKNHSATSLAERSYLITTDYENGGTISGPSSLTDIHGPAYYPRIDMRGSSSNSGILSGYLLFFDQALILNETNVGYGFDAISNPGSIGSSVIFLSRGKDASGLGDYENEVDCSWLQELGGAAISNTFSANRCPGQSTTLYSQMYMNYAGVGAIPPYSSPVTATYVWQPGNISGQNITVFPLVTTVYTVTATYQGCVFTQTVLVPVEAYSIPTISYSNTTVIFPSVNTFPVIRTGTVTGGIYSITKLGGGSCSGVSINSVGVIAVTNSVCYGSYVVRLCIILPPHSYCESYCVSTLVDLTDGSCPLAATQPTLSLCPGDKADLVITGIPTTYSWQPATGLSCTNCKTPLLTMDDAGERTYTVTAKNDGVVCGSTTIRVLAKTDCQKDEIIGCCFGNYGAAVQVQNATYLNIYCNLINELGSTSPVVTPATLEKGEFRNQEGGHVRVLLDWIHNAKNTLYIPALTTATPAVTVAHAGTTTVFGDNQQLKGNSSTEFNELRLEGSGIKSLWVNEYGYWDLNLNDLMLNLQNFTYAVKDPAADVKRTTGYASSSKNGYLSRVMNAAPVSYLFPMGSPANAGILFRYRPIILKNNVLVPDEISVNFMNMAPSYGTDHAFVSPGAGTPNTSLQAPNVALVNHNFYHKIKKTLPSAAVSNLNINYYFTPSDGMYQSISEWEQDPAQPASWWGSTPGPGVVTTTSSAADTYGMMHAVANGTFDFNHKPFALSRSGFYLNTNSFGDFGGTGTTNGTSISLTASSTGAGIPTGGGIGSSFGTGATSGNTGAGGNTIFAPTPVSGNYVMTITPPNSCAIPGRIKFVIDANGTIDPASFEYGDSTNSAGYYGSLSESLYTVDNVNSGITFSATPRELIRSCVNLISVRTSSLSDFILQKSLSPEEKIEVILPTSISYTYGTFTLKNLSTGWLYPMAAPVPGINTYQLSVALPPAVILPDGPYEFSFTITRSGTPAVSDTIKGQLIIK